MAPDTLQSACRSRPPRDLPVTLREMARKTGKTNPGDDGCRRYVMVVFWHRTLQNYPGHWTKTGELGIPRRNSINAISEAAMARAEPVGASGRLASRAGCRLAPPLRSRPSSGGTFFARFGVVRACADKSAAYLELVNSGKRRKPMLRQFRDRYEAGRLLATKLDHLSDRDDLIALALPRGGVPVAFEIANRLNAPLDVFLVRKLGVPGQEELAMGAIAQGETLVLNQDLIDYLAIPRSVVDAVAALEGKELERRDKLYRGVKPPPELGGKAVILVDDGLATGSTMRAAISAVRHQKPRQITVAVPVAPPSTLAQLEGEADEVISLWQPEPFDGVGRWYSDFSQTSDDEVRRLLEQSQVREPNMKEANRGL